MAFSRGTWPGRSGRQNRCPAPLSRPLFPMAKHVQNPEGQGGKWTVPDGWPLPSSPGTGQSRAARERGRQASQGTAFECCDPDHVHRLVNQTKQNKLKQTNCSELLCPSSRWVWNEHLKGESPTWWTVPASHWRMSISLVLEPERLWGAVCPGECWGGRVSPPELCVHEKRHRDALMSCQGSPTHP